MVRLGITQQIISVLIIASILAAFELVFFLKIVCPKVEDFVVSQLKQSFKPADQPDTSATAVLLKLMQQREQANSAAHNRSGVAFGILISLAPICAAMGMMIGDARLRTRSSLADIATNVAVVSAGVISFQLLFYQFGLRYRYPTMESKMVKVLKHYEDNNASSCPQWFLDNAANAANESGMMAMLQELGGGGGMMGGLPNLPMGDGNLPNLPMGAGNLPNLPMGGGNLPNLPIGGGNLPNLPMGGGNLQPPPPPTTSVFY